MKSLLNLLIALLPRLFRDRFGEDMRDQIATDLRKARSKGWGTALVFTLATALDLVHTAFAERWNPTWVEGATRGSRTTQLGMEVGTMVGHGLDDLGQAARALRRAPGFTMVAVGTLGIALGALAGVFTVVDAVLLDPLPYDEPDRLVAIRGAAPGTELPAEFPLSGEFYLQYRESELLADVATYTSYTNSLRVDDRVERVRIGTSTASLRYSDACRKTTRTTWCFSATRSGRPGSAPTPP
jgi:hypothetical protein